MTRAIGGWQDALRRVAVVVAWVGVLAAVIAGMHLAGRGALAAPPMTDLAAWGRFLSRTEPVTAAFAVGRLAVLAAAWYLLASPWSGSCCGCWAPGGRWRWPTS